jgi:hypothetical protein
MATRAADLERYRSSAPYFLALLALAIPAFWPSYLHAEKVEGDPHVHVHGISLFLWSVMLIVQPWLIQRGRWRLHRRVGKLSYALAPVIVISTVLLVRFRLATNQDADQVYFAFVQLGLIAVFAIAYVQAIRWRHAAGTHARYMVCTALTMVDPIVARLLFIYADVPAVWEQVVTYGIIDAIIVALWWRDRRLGNGIRAFPVMLAAFLAMQVGTFVVPPLQPWREFAAWFGTLPLP